MDENTHKVNSLNEHKVDSYVNFVREKGKEINKISPTFCLAKWLQSTILLYNGQTHSCHHPSRHSITLDDIKDNPKGIHNTAIKIHARKEMLDGIQTAECDYCWKIENLNKDHISDRIYKSTYTWALPYVNDVVASGVGKDIDPTYVEVAFDSTCNFKCIYCSPVSSSKWQEEIETHGPIQLENHSLHDIKWLKNTNQLPIPNKDYNPYIDAFWQWWPELYPKLHTFRITGGEPLLSKHVWGIFDYIKEHPNKNLILALNTNLNAPDKLVDRMIENINAISDNINYVDIYTSLESTGEQAEYTRFGMNYEEFLSNCIKVLDNTPSKTRLHFMTTINVLSATTFIDFLKLIKTLREKYKTEKHNFRVRTHLSFLRWPQCLQISLLSDEDKTKYSKEWSDFINENTLTADKLENETFYLEEVDQLNRLIDYMKNTRETATIYDEFRSYVAQCDERRGVDFSVTFPELTYLMENDYYGR
jgi:organic radical activating enzyme